MFSILGLFGLAPLIGQSLIWFFGRVIISNLSEFLFHVPTDTVFWDTSKPLNTFLYQFSVQLIQATYTDFLFWSILVFSILISIDSITSWQRRRAYKKQEL